MSANVYAFLFAGVVGAAVALYVWLKDENTPHRNNRPRRPPPPSPPPHSSNETGSDCIVCENPSTVKFVPCLHSCLCSNCFSTYLKHARKCPLCRIEIDDVISSA
ncbi:hypothetical protein JTE90_008685 [Oedothorax gibbosus]|uniref:RING-type domain-containing protein n=1 Tax=Oedothorax gibbosus TaxID=931172 RepID=A0AAV6TR81_9ARAC|nr:hypothetical protein JTE90_008685 [Oedothorax gibbosus]